MERIALALTVVAFFAFAEPVKAQCSGGVVFGQPTAIGFTPGFGVVRFNTGLGLNGVAISPTNALFLNNGFGFNAAVGFGNRGFVGGGFGNRGFVRGFVGPRGGFAFRGRLR